MTLILAASFWGIPGTESHFTATSSEPLLILTGVFPFLVRLTGGPSKRKGTLEVVLNGRLLSSGKYHVCMCVCVCVCVCVCLRVWLFVCVCICLFGSVFVWLVFLMHVFCCMKKVRYPLVIGVDWWELRISTSGS